MEMVFNGYSLTGFEFHSPNEYPVTCSFFIIVENKNKKGVILCECEQEKILKA